MSTRRKQRTDTAGLFTWTPTGIRPNENRTNPRRRKCDTCRARPGDPCTRPTRRGRVPLPGYHPARRQRPEETTP